MVAQKPKQQDSRRSIAMITALLVREHQTLHQKTLQQ
jgi:hypothetical protein